MRMDIHKITVPNERRALRQIEDLAGSIARVGLLNPITVTPQGRLIAGYHRLEACKRLGWAEIPVNVLSCGDLETELAEIDENLIRNELSVLERGEQLARRKALYEAMHPETKHGKTPGNQYTGQKRETEMISFSQDTAAKTGVTDRTIRQEVQIANHLTEAAKNRIRGSALEDSKTDLLKLARLEPEKQAQVADLLVSGEAKTFTDARRLTHREAVHQAPPLCGKYRVIYADPPWPYRHSGLDDYGHAERHYPTLSLEALAALPVKDLAEANSVLFLWVTSPMLEVSFPVMRAWGFDYKTSFVWDKVKHNMGHYNSVRHELLLIGGKGSSTPEVATLYDSVVSIERTEHSRKPAYFRQLIETLYPSARKIELFAREGDIPGWATWGNQVLSTAPEKVTAQAQGVAAG